MEEDARISLSLPGKYLYQLDAMNGTVSLAANTEEGAGRVSTNVTLPPAGSALFFAAGKKVFEVTETAPAECLTKTLEATAPVAVSPVRANALCLDFCNLTVEDEQWHDIFHKVANDRLWQHFGQRDPWETAVQFRHDILDRDTFSRGDIKVEYPFHVAEAFDWSDMTITVEKPEMWQVAVNGIEIKEFAEDNLLDHRCGVFRIGQAVKQGNNTVTLSMSRMNIRAEIAPVMLMGRFALTNAERGFVLSPAPEALALGDYTKQGYAEYPWEMAYKKHYTIDDPAKRHIVRLGRWNGTVAQVWVNGTKAGCIAYPPYELDITTYMQQGENEVEMRVIGSLANLYGPHYSQTNGLMGPGHWNGVGEQRPGADYHVFPYGLEDDFELHYAL